MDVVCVCVCLYTVLEVVAHTIVFGVRHSSSQLQGGIEQTKNGTYGRYNKNNLLYTFITYYRYVGYELSLYSV